MFQQALTILIGILGGVSVGIQGPITNSIGQRTGSATSTLIVHATGTFFSGLLLILRGGEQFGEVRNLPWWAFGSGLFGVLVLLTINVTIPRIGVTAASTLIIVGQLITGTLIDQFGWFGVTPRPIDGMRILGAIFLLVGAYLITRPAMNG